MPCAYVPEGSNWEKKSRVAGRFSSEEAAERPGTRRKPSRAMQLAEGLKGGAVVSVLRGVGTPAFPWLDGRLRRTGKWPEQLTILKE